MGSQDGHGQAEFASEADDWLSGGRLMIQDLERISAAHSASVDTIFNVTRLVFDGVERMVLLQLSFTKDSLNEAGAYARSIVVDDRGSRPIAFQRSEALKPGIERAWRFSEGLAQSISDLQRDLAAFLTSMLESGCPIVAPLAPTSSPKPRKTASRSPASA